MDKIFRKKRNPNFDLVKMGLLGRYLTYVPCANCFTDVKVRVVGKNVVEYNGEEISCHLLNKKLNKYHRQGTITHEFQASNYFSYNGRMIDDMWSEFCEKGNIDIDSIGTNSNDKFGYIYAFKNPSFKNVWMKIGKTNNWKRRLKELSNSTSIPFNFEIVCIIKVKDMNSVEKYIHNTLENVMGCRVNKKREFFEIEEEKVIKLFQYLNNYLFKNTSELVKVA